MRSPAKEKPDAEVKAFWAAYHAMMDAAKPIGLRVDVTITDANAKPKAKRSPRLSRTHAGGGTNG